jgi:hypothetical protein
MRRCAQVLAIELQRNFGEEVCSLQQHKKKYEADSIRAGSSSGRSNNIDDQKDKPYRRFHDLEDEENIGLQAMSGKHNYGCNV